MSYVTHVQPETLQGQAVNNGGGHSFAVSDWVRLQRFLVLGCEGGSYYATERKLTVDNAQCVVRCAKVDFQRTLAMVVRVSTDGRAPKNTPAIFALALLASLPDTRSALALAHLRDVCRIGTHLFQFVDAVSRLRGWGRSLRSAVGDWYLQRSPLAVAKQVVKYGNREGWTHRDVLRQAHPKASIGTMDGVLAYAVGKPWLEKVTGGVVRDYLQAVEEVKAIGCSLSRMVELVTDYQLPWEVLPTEAHEHREVWEALLPSMGAEAMLRNLGRFSRLGLFDSTANVDQVCGKFTDVQWLAANRLHPFKILLGLTTYSAGRGVKGSHTWNPARAVTAAAEQAFYAAFGLLPRLSQRVVIGLDVSGSMASSLANSHLTCRDAAAAMTMVLLRQAEQTQVMAFSHQLVPLALQPTDSLPTVVRKTSGLGFGATACALPIQQALACRQPVDTFVIYTDNETNSGPHPVQALRLYREQMGIPAKLVVVGFTATEFSVADPQDAGMLDVVGFDAAAPEIMHQFIEAGITIE